MKNEHYPVLGWWITTLSLHASSVREIQPYQQWANHILSSAKSTKRVQTPTARGRLLAIGQWKHSTGLPRSQSTSSWSPPPPKPRLLEKRMFDALWGSSNRKFPFPLLPRVRNREMLAVFSPKTCSWNTLKQNTALGCSKYGIFCFWCLIIGLRH